MTYSLGSSDDVQYTYDRQGETTSMTDQNGTTHAYSFDHVGRELADSVTGHDNSTAGIAAASDSTLAAALVTTVAFGYKPCGKLQTVTSENADNTILNQIYYVYDTSGILDAEYQNHTGAVNFSTSEYVAYGNDASTTTETVAGVSDVTVSQYGYRPTTLQYPTTTGVASTLVTNSYTGSDDQSDIDNAINRLDTLKLGTATTTASSTNGQLTTTSSSAGSALAAYTYLGIDTVVKEDYAQPEIKLDYTGSSSGNYSGLDNFNRVIDQVWKEYGSSPSTLDEYKYGRNAQGSITYRQNVKAGSNNLDQIYTNNGLGELTSLAQGSASQYPRASLPSMVPAMPRSTPARRTSRKVLRSIALAIGRTLRNRTTARRLRLTRLAM